MATWALQDAKAKFSEVVDRAITEGPQRITRHGRPAVRVVADTGDEKVAPDAPKMSFGEFLLAMPQYDGPGDPFERIEIELRDIDFGEPE